MKLTKDHCLSLDGCCASRIKVSIFDFERILSHPCNEDEQAISAYFQCPESTRSCCDCLGDSNGGGHYDDEHNNDDHDDDKDGKDKDGK